MSMSVLYDAPGPKTRRNSAIASVIGAVAILAGLTWVFFILAAPRVNANGAEQPGMFDPSRTDILSDPQVWGAFGGAVVETLRMAGVAAVLAILVGILFSFGRTAASKWVRIPTSVLLEFFRGMPLLLMILFVFLLFSTGSYWAGVLGLAVYNGAIIGEALRAGINSLPKGQREGGLSVGLTSLQTRFIIEFPQAFRQMLPIILAQLVVLLKDTSLAYVVAYPELARTIKNLQNFYGSRYLFTLFAVGFVIYLVMNVTLSYIARYAAKRSGPKLGKVTPDNPKVPGAEGTRAITMPRGRSGYGANSGGGFS
ncbi:amino acid ABC transporter permease [Salinibacterium sp. TMP30]|uniref:amino acid ABC transporter permease n=1 Tax=Salinibacterium sp. TMP30 TaxID=3138237 RepID=UPI003138D60E